MTQTLVSIMAQVLDEKGGEGPAGIFEDLHDLCNERLRIAEDKEDRINKERWYRMRKLCANSASGAREIDFDLKEM